MRRIKDIRIYFSTKELETKFAFVRNVRIVRIPFRFASKLKELGFTLAKIDHVYIEIIEEGALEFYLKDKEHEYEARIRTVNTIVTAPQNEMSFEQEHDFVVHLISSALKVVASEAGASIEDVEATERLMLEQREKASILLKNKTTSDYVLSAFFLCSPPSRELETTAYGNGLFPHNVSGVLRITNRTNGLSAEIRFFDGSLGTLDSLVGGIVVNGDTVTFKPKVTNKMASEIERLRKAGYLISEFSISGLFETHLTSKSE